MLLLNISSSNAFLSAVGQQSGRIGIHNRAVLQFQPIEEFASQSVVRRLELRKFLRAKPPEKFPHRVTVRKIIKPEQRGNQAIVNKTLSVFHATNTSYDTENMRHEDVGRMVLPIIVIGPPNGGLEETSNCKMAAKRLEKAESAKACQPFVFEQKTKFPWSPGHIAQMYLKSTFVQSPQYQFFVHRS